MSRIVPCDGCGTRYDVSSRRPGQRVRCPRCRGVLVVPAADDPTTTASARLRLALGPRCPRHPRASAERDCQLCRTHLCEACFAPPPIDHACRRCARARGLEGAVDVPFGIAATYALAARSFAASFWRVLAWSVLAFAFTFTTCALPAALGLYVARSNPGDPALEPAGLLVAIVGFALSWVLTQLLLLPAGGVLLLDDAVRGRRHALWETVTLTANRLLDRAGPLLALLVVYATATLLLCAVAGVTFFGAWLALGLRAEDVAQAPARLLAPIAVLLGVFGVGAVLLISAFGLAVPIVLLEERPAVAALARAWDLARPRLGSVCAIVVLFGCFTVVGGALCDLLGRALGIRPVGVVLASLLDLCWPPVLVATYHGLTADEVGRSSPKPRPGSHRSSR